VTSEHDDVNCTCNDDVDGDDGLVMKLLMLFLGDDYDNDNCD